MATRALRLCNHVGCSRLVSSGYCDLHTVTYVYKRDKTHQKMYNKRWQRERRLFLNDNTWCSDCMEIKEYTAASEVHHITKHNGDYIIFWDKHNWKALCKSCHSKRTAKGE